MTRAEAGRRGGNQTFNRYGPEHMRKIGKRGAATLWARYALYPYELSKFVLVDRTTGTVKAIR